ncbi:hypothetical protein HOL21_02270 [Candidatus Woesearchaeota archaeon]|jgi:hypothetical protein|nr:hypothetical protein [Candidatus Woesearchaeota archaeon]MBT5397016.1 hypothetical protein [Candidatus Woesearchaeota archaeon]MBT5924577.1 hypothetical protein [Candidatus Woesearchaeota archaeon]MBT6367438.1 hypothetical protein [Candidatus Woesearchaeota archaeon]MBT7762416.1 hypothetical protein [Candidatus Woesearchaeota archaeon]
MSADKIKGFIQRMTGHQYIEITTRGNSAIDAALSAVPLDRKVCIPQEGGWLTYKTLPQKKGLKSVPVMCNDARIDMKDLRTKIETGLIGALLYQQPGGYFAEQPVEEIYKLCHSAGVLVIVDVSGAIGTPLCDPQHADILVGSFGRWKPINAKVGGFVSCREEKVWDKVFRGMKPLTNDDMISQIYDSFQELPHRVAKLVLIRDKVLKDLADFDIVHPYDNGFVVVIRYHSKEAKSAIIDYCKENGLEYTECPRYIRLNDKAISIEIKRL